MSNWFANGDFPVYAKLMKLTRPLLLTLLLFTLAACGGLGNTSYRTLEAFDLTFEVQMESLAITSTVEVERMLATAESAQRRISRSATQQIFMISTLESRGIDTSNLPRVITPTPAPENANNGTSSNNNDGAVATRIQVTPFVPTEPAVPTPDDPNQPQLTEVELAPGVANNNCAQNPTSTFTPSSERVYIVARALNIEPGTQLTSRWYRGEEPLVDFDFTPDFRIADACIWFYADQSNFEFLPGIYSIVLEMNGQPAAPETRFTITGDMPPESADDDSDNDGA